MRRCIRLAVIATGCLIVTACIVAQPNPYPPPPPRVEVVPAPPRTAMVWEPGHWFWPAGSQSTSSVLGLH